MKYCTAWLADYATYDAVLLKATIKNTPDIVQRTDEMRQAFRHIKYLLCMAPALVLPDYKLRFHLYVAQNGLVASDVLAQTRGDRLRPVAYYSKTLPLIVQRVVPCLKAVAAAAMIVKKHKLQF